MCSHFTSCKKSLIDVQIPLTDCKDVDWFYHAGGMSVLTVGCTVWADVHLGSKLIQQTVIDS